MTEYMLGHAFARDLQLHRIEVLLQSALGAVVILIWPRLVNEHHVLNPIARNRSASHAFTVRSSIYRLKTVTSSSITVVSLIER